MTIATALGLPEHWESRLHEAGTPVTLDASQYICMEGSLCQGLAIVIDGVARVYKIAENGREITLYRLHQGDTCILTASCLLSGNAFPAFALTETTLKALIIPEHTFRDWVNEYEEWRTYVFNLIYSRLQSVITLVEEVTFRRLDVRLADYLLARMEEHGGDSLRATHESIAFDLGTSREVISRLLKEFEHEGLVGLERGGILLQNREGLLKQSARKG